ncbi:adenylyl-sulfate kinase [Shivajiella indica]|uniref:Adenylyl-sulfate kinase n=1 Tax=Shivajiella indica TaxID=872115 RepID=A0ABW5BCB2_9BACT
MKQKPKLIWFTGLSGSGKSTLANGTEVQLHEKGFKTFLLDGDNVRAGLNKDLGFSEEDRIENIRRIGEVSKLMLDAGLIVISAFISPFRHDRKLIEQLVGKDNFLEIFVDCPLEICEQRDVKGLYKKARQGIIQNFTGINSPYEKPLSPFLRVQTDQMELDKAIQLIIKKVQPELKKY